MNVPIHARAVTKKEADYLTELLNLFNNESEPIEQRIQAGVEIHKLLYGEPPEGLMGGN